MRAGSSDHLLAGLSRTARERPDAIAFEFMTYGTAGLSAEAITYATLDRRARAVAAVLQPLLEPGARAVLSCPPGLDYVVGLLGSLYAGVVTVPLYPPLTPRQLDVFMRNASDCAPRIVLTTASVRPLRERFATRPSSLAHIPWLDVGSIPTGTEHTLISSAPPPEAPALLQYTSGSTGAPKGVVVTRSSLLDNMRAIRDACRLTERDRSLSWLPPYHDMGLVAGILVPLFVGCHATLMSSLSFLQRPFRWLEAISRRGITFSGAPNFALDLCTRRITADQRSSLDLGSWEVAYCGSEPVRASTLARFAEAFAMCGFRREALRPCYGMAEATLGISIGSRLSSPTVLRVERRMFENVMVVPVDATSADAVEVVSCGRPDAHHEILVVEPSTRLICAEDRIGELWLRGPSVAAGYWQDPVATRETFAAHVREASDGPERDGTYLRTGDLGFLHGGEVFVVGRLKDVIIVRGFKHHPAEIEATVEASHCSLRLNGGVAFSADTEAGEALVIVHELKSTNVDARAVLDAIRVALISRHRLSPHAIVLVEPGTIPRTLNGKLARAACRASFSAHTLARVATWQSAGASTPQVTLVPVA